LGSIIQIFKEMIDWSGIEMVLQNKSAARTQIASSYYHGYVGQKTLSRSLCLFDTAFHEVGPEVEQMNICRMDYIWFKDNGD